MPLVLCCLILIIYIIYKSIIYAWFCIIVFFNSDIYLFVHIWFWSLRSKMFILPRRCSVPVFNVFSSCTKLDLVTLLRGSWAWASSVYKMLSASICNIIVMNQLTKIIYCTIINTEFEYAINSIFLLIKTINFKIQYRLLFVFGRFHWYIRTFNCLYWNEMYLNIVASSFYGPGILTSWCSSEAPNIDELLSIHSWGFQIIVFYFELFHV